MSMVARYAWMIPLSSLLVVPMGCGDDDEPTKRDASFMDGGSGRLDGGSPDLALGRDAADAALTGRDGGLDSRADVAAVDGSSRSDGGVDGGTSFLDGSMPGMDGGSAIDVAAAVDVAAVDGSAQPPVDGGFLGDVPIVSFACGAFPVDTEWTTAAGYRASTVAQGGLIDSPVAIAFAGGAFGSYAYVAEQGENRVVRIDPSTGTASLFIGAVQWPSTPDLLTNIVWDATAVFDGNLYISDQGTAADGDSSIFRADPTGVVQVFATAPGPGLDDAFGLAFSPGGTYPAGLFVGGDTDGTAAGFGVYNATAVGTAFAAYAGIQGLAVDTSARFGGGLFAAMPASGGYSGDDTLTRILPDGSKGTPLVTDAPGIHGIAFAPQGPFGADAYVASFDTQNIVRVSPDGTTTEVAGGVGFSNFDGNVLAFSPDGRVLLVAERMRNRIVCVESTL